MTGILLALFLLQVNPPPTGIVTGVVQSADGKPAPGIRVFAVPAGDVNAIADNATVLESLTQTDATGHYRLEVPVGRYTIAAGSVQSPTFFPGTPDVTTAKIVSVVANATVSNVDFPRFVPASGLIGVALPPGSTGILSGVIRTPAGNPAVGMGVVLIPAIVLNGAQGANPTAGPTTISPLAVSGLIAQPAGPAPLTVTSNTQILLIRRTVGEFRGTTDGSGHYRFANVSPGTYYVAAGFSNAPVYYPGTDSFAAAMSITTTPTTTINTLNFTLPSTPLGTTLSGKVTAITGTPAADATVELQSARSPAISTLASYLPTKPAAKTSAATDGVFKFANVLPGSYELTYRVPDIAPITRNVVVGDRPVENLDQTFPAVALSGRIVSEDGRPFPDLRSLGQVGVSELLKANGYTRVLNVSQDGRFSRLIEAGEYRVYLSSLAQEYTVQSMTAGTSDLTRESLNVHGDASVDIEIRIKKRAESNLHLSGRVIDAISGAPAVTERLQLCCFDSGPVERISTTIHPDGSFDFAGVPPGKYTTELVGSEKSSILDPAVEQGDQGSTSITLVSVTQFASVIASSIVEGGGYQPSGMIVTFTGAGGIIKLAAATDTSGMFRVRLPAGERYSVSVSNIPEGYVLKSVTSNTPELVNGILKNTPGADRNVLFVTLTPAPAR